MAEFDFNRPTLIKQTQSFYDNNVGGKLTKRAKRLYKGKENEGVDELKRGIESADKHFEEVIGKMSR
jgi:hypothetical protein